MTDETYERLVEHLGKHTIPPIPPMLPKGWGLGLYVDETVAVNQPVLEPSRVRLHPDDYIDLQRRLDAQR